MDTSSGAERTPQVVNSSEVNEKIKQFKKMLAENPDSGWDTAWKQDITPWDAGKIQPPLRDLIESYRLDLPVSGKALVPGCGKGYDAIFIASSLGLDTLAVDISETAVQAASAQLSTAPVVPSGKVSFEAVDFFSMSLPEDERFDLVYDHTFFVAIPPSRRNDWGRQITALTKPGAFLITLVFPLGLSPDDGGPPFYVQPEHYHEPLAGWTKVLDEVPKVSSEHHIGKDRLVVWRKDAA